jgi:hypothetical protein
VINAAFNVAISIQRTDAGLFLEDSDSGGCANLEESADDAASGETPDCGGGGDPQGKKDTVDELLRLANIEAQDAINVLQAKGLHADAVALLQSAVNKNNQAIAENATMTRLSFMQGARNDFAAAKAKFGTGLNFALGEGNLLF